MNELYGPCDAPLLFEARVALLAEGTEVDAFAVYYLVPPYCPGPSGPDPPGCS